MINHFKTALVTALLLAGATQWGMTQTRRPATDGGERPWYLGVQGGTSLGQGTFRSITEHEFLPGLQGGVFGGYRLNRLFSLEAGFQYGAQTQKALDCCQYWLGEDGVRYMAPVVDQTGWYYHDLDTRTQWGKLAFLVNADLLSLFTAPDCRWSLNLAPQISAVTTKTTHITPDKEIPHDRQWLLGLGGQASVGYQITERIGASLYGGITCLTGERFDNIPVHAHKSNLMYDAGVKVTLSIGSKKKVQTAPEAVPIPVVEPEKPEEEPVAQPEETVQPEEPVKVEEPVQPDTSAAEKEAADKEAAFNTPIPNVYFADNSHTIRDISIPDLEAALAILNKYPDFSLEIHAYCSNTGTEEYNKKLSQQRVEEVQYWFVGHGIAMERLSNAYAHGIDYNAPNADEARRAKLKFVK